VNLGREEAEEACLTGPGEGLCRPACQANYSAVSVYCGRHYGLHSLNDAHPVSFYYYTPYAKGSRQLAIAWNRGEGEGEAGVGFREPCYDEQGEGKGD
jgi:hypothetical protein